MSERHTRTLLRGCFALIEADAHTFDVAADYVPSREFSEHAEADRIASVLKSVVALQRPAVTG